MPFFELEDGEKVMESAWCGFPFNDPNRKWETLDAVFHIPVLRGAHDPHHSAVLQDLPHPVQSTEPVQDRYSWGREE
ncbi:hypothetical protein CEXT_213001 [Caerostris extrusa]|uniref:Uncharacterized protein n=1 Tax=Caerostris extrusa TaxID=172846 RepID=A0AAV4SXI8_CAEEX|nr:hypothetical protein CEXT_213001 [Caerostris extrusa]